MVCDWNIFTIFVISFKTSVVYYDKVKIILPIHCSNINLFNYELQQ